LVWFVPDTAESQSQAKPRLTNLGIRIVESPSISIERSRRVVLRMGNICDQLSRRVLDIRKSETPDQQQVDASYQDEEVLDGLQDEIIEFITSMLSGTISQEVAWSARQQLRMADDLESISDYLITILKSDLKLRQSELSLPETEKLGIIEAHEAVNEMIDKVIRYYFGRRTGRESETMFLEEIRSRSREINSKVKGIRNDFIRRISDEKYDPQVVIALNTQINAYRRVREHVRNVARAIVGVR
jgi:phosphate:Na+ symporter